MDTDTYYSLLIIDDDVIDIALYKELLTASRPSAHYEFEVAHTGRQGLKLFQDFKPDCVLLDYNLPDITGLELLRQLREISSVLPVVMLTGQGSETIAAETIKSGAQNYMPKNAITAESLHQAIQNTIERARLLQQVERKNRELEEAKIRAETADRSKSEFLATMSHEIRTPLSGILGMADLLSNTVLNHKQHKYVSSIMSSSELLLTIINDILDFSKIEAGDMELEEEHLELKPLLTEITQLLSARSNENNVELAVRWPPGDDMPAIRSDAVRLRQILINLVGNAVKFTRDGYVIVQVHAPEPCENGKIRLRFDVEDDGIGIPEDKLDHIFERFSQVDSTTTRKYGGTGLGLAICKRLVNMLGGELSVKSTVGRGSTFSFDITAAVSEKARSIIPAQQESLASMRVLIVDDYDLNIDLLSEYLADTGMHIEGAMTGQHALEKLSKAQKAGRPYDLVLTDFAMPKMNGRTLVSAIKEQPDLYGGPKSILITAMGKNINDYSHQTAEFEATLLKPVYPDTLIATIDVLFTPQEAGNEDEENDTGDGSSDMVLPDISAHVLLVDDDRISARMSQSILDELDCTYDLAKNGLEALEILKNNHAAYDLVFMDWQMPVMDGHEAIRNIRQQSWGKELKIVALTASAIRGDREKCLTAGADDYLSKPVRLAEMLAVLNKYIDPAQSRVA